MENTSTNFAESTADLITLESQHIHFSPLAFSNLEPEDEDEDDTADEDEDEGGERSKSSDDENPPLDKDIVHSPLPPQTGGKPR